MSFDKRVLEQTYAYDWLGNLTTSGDDAKGFYDRSLGAQSHNGTKPYQLTSATGSASTRDGNLTLAYDATGNTTSMALVRDGACLPSGATCSQRFGYEWDEVGRLSRARRWDLSSPGAASDPLPSTTPAVELRYAYDASDNRVLKTAVDAQANELHTVYVFGSLELRRTVFDNGDYADTKDTEVAYLFAHGVRLARLHYSEDSLPTLTSGRLHVLIELPDHLGSSSIVIDKETGELAERSTYQVYGAADSDYRPDRWGSFREDYKFTGKEEDAEVGLDYFGKRYLAVGLNRWLSADPLAVQAPGEADLNLYAYVHGAVLKATDPLGLESLPGGTPDDGSKNSNGAGGEDGHYVVTDVSKPQRADPKAADTRTVQQSRVAAFVAHENQPWPGSLPVPKAAPTDEGGSLTEPLIAGFLGGGTAGVLDVLHAEANSREDAGVGPAELPPGGTDYSAGGESGLLSDTNVRHATGAAVDAALAEALQRVFAGGGALAAEGDVVRPVAASGAHPGLADLPMDVAVPVRAAEPIEIPRALSSREMAALTNTTGNIEFSQTFVKGQHWLTRADFSTPNKVFVLPWQPGDTQWISHSHPRGFSGAPSAQDRRILRMLGQDTSSVVRPDGSSVRYGQ